MKFSPETERTWQFRARPYGTTGFAETIDAVRSTTWRDVAGKITTPLLITSPEGEQFWPRPGRTARRADRRRLHDRRGSPPRRARANTASRWPAPSPPSACSTGSTTRSGHPPARAESVGPWNRTGCSTRSGGTSTRSGSSAPSGDSAGAARRPPARAPRRLARLRRRARCVRARARAGVRLGDARLRHRRPLPHRPAAGRRRRLRRAGRRRARARPAGAARRRVQPRRAGAPRVPGRAGAGPAAPTAAWFRLRWPSEPRAEPGTTLRGPRRAGRAGPRRARRRRPRRRGDDATGSTAGVDGWRLDAAYAVPTVVLGAACCRRVRERHPDAYVVGEVIHGDYAGFVARVGHGRRHPVRAVEGDLELAQRRQLVRARRTRSAGTTSCSTTFVPLDVPRQPRRHPDRQPARPTSGTCRTRWPCCSPSAGTPSVYAGDEQAFRGVKEDRAGGDDAVRPPFPATPGRALAARAGRTYRLHQELIGLRRRHRWLHRARTTTLHLANTAVAATRSRRTAGGWWWR